MTVAVTVAACGPAASEHAAPAGVTRRQEAEQPARHSGTFRRGEHAPCGQDWPRPGLYPQDAYRTVWSAQPFSCELPVNGEIPESWAQRVIPRDERCYATFVALHGASKAKAVAFWLFGLTEAGDGLLGRPDVLQITPLESRGDPLLDGAVNLGVFTVASPLWPQTMTVKFVPGWELVSLARLVMAPPTSTGCIAQHLQRSTIEVDEHDLRTLPKIAVPLAAGAFCRQTAVGHTCDVAAEEGEGIVLMETAAGRQPDRSLSPGSAQALQTSLQEAWLEGRALALFQMPFIQDDGTDIFAQSIWQHNDLHRGNVFVDVGSWQVAYLDFPKMARQAYWMGSRAGDDATIASGFDVPRSAMTERLLAGRQASAAGCVAGLQDWLGRPEVEAALRQEDPAWWADQHRFLHFRRGYLAYVPAFARAQVEGQFDQACRRVLGDPP